MLVGTARSGTTLAQRLACELAGVRVPHETHFFNRYAGELLARRRFPLGATELRQELDAFLSVDTSHGLPLDPERVVELLGGTAGTALELFAAIVHALAGGGAILGEKTPEHLLWWEPLARAMPQLRLVGIVRDPRAVVASQRHVDWGIKSHVQLATQWSLDQHELLRARATLGASRFLLLRYEDLVQDPERARRGLAAFLRADGVASEEPEAERLVLPWEHWKQRVFRPITTDRTEAWRRELSERDADDVTAIGAAQMQELGYGQGAGAPRGRGGEPGHEAARERIVDLHERRMRGIRYLTGREDWMLGGLPPLPVCDTPYGRHEWQSPATDAAASVG